MALLSELDGIFTRKEGQRTTLSLGGKDVSALLPTGFGKSLNKLFMTKLCLRYITFLSADAADKFVHDPGELVLSSAGSAAPVSNLHVRQSARQRSGALYLPHSAGGPYPSMDIYGFNHIGRVITPLLSVLGCSS